MQPSRRHFDIEMAIQFLVVNLVNLPNYRMIKYNFIFNLSSGVTCNWCIQLDAPQSLGLRLAVSIVGCRSTDLRLAVSIVGCRSTYSRLAVSIV